MKPFRFLYLLAALLMWPTSGWTKPEPPTKEAKDRAALYQVEARAVLTDHRWRVAADQPGSLVATHPLGPQGARFPGSYNSTLGYAYLTIAFVPKTSGNTGCTASIVAYFRWKDAGINKTWDGPYPFNNPDATKDLQEMMAKAEKQMTAKHPEYAAK